MRVIYGINQIKKFKNPVAALGVFDGLHRGHQEILKAVSLKARAIKGTSTVLTFWPHPQRKESLYSLEHRLRLIEDLGIDVCIVINFNQRFAACPAEDFVRDILIGRLSAHYIYVGKNFRFGRYAAGDFRVLKRLSRVYNFSLKLFDVIRINKRPISSTYIRSLIKKGKLGAAEKLLRRPVSILGTVIKGAALAKQLGFPTANINPHHEVIPPSGVYAVSVIFNKKKYGGICYIGSKPTFAARRARRTAHSAQRIEAHIFNFNKDIYGKYLEIRFIKKIRDEKKFKSLSSLSAQVKKDILRAKNIFSLP